jgi:hypothetical protein
LTPTELIDYLPKAIRAGMPVLIHGKPGVGKTAVCQQVAETLGYHALFSHPVTDEPVDYKGLPWIENGVAKFFPIGTINDVLSATEPTVWFIDDVGQAPLSVQAALMQWTHKDSRCLNGQKLPDCVTIVMMTNRKEDRAGVSGFLEPFKSRFSTIVELEAHLKSFLDWGVDNEIDDMILNYVNWKPEQLSHFEPSSGLDVSPSPRGWQHLNSQIQLQLPMEIEAEVYTGCIGKSAANEFLAFRRIYSKLPPLSLCETQPDTAPMPMESNVLFALTGSLAKRTNDQNIGAITQYCKRLPDEFKVVYTEMLNRYWKQAANTAEYGAWAVSIQHIMV